MGSKKGSDKKVADQISPKGPGSYNTFLNRCLTELEAKNHALSDQYGLGSYGRWDVDQTTGVLTFSNKGVAAIVCDVDFLGSFSSVTNTWLWGWANESILEPLTKNVLRVREYGEREGWDDLVTRKIECSEDEAWSFAAAALRILDGLGVYRGPTGNGCVMMMIKTIQKVSGQKSSRSRRKSAASQD